MQLRQMRPAAIGILFSQDKAQVLLVKRRDVPVWVLPGGGIENNETPEFAACREFFEETGIQVKPVRKVGEYLPVNRLAEQSFVFECAPLSDLPSTLKPQVETAEVAFFDIHKLPCHFFFLHKEWLDDALHNFPRPVIRNMDNINWKNLFLYVLSHPILFFRYLITRFGLHINSKSHYDRSQ
jgi:8-oxo-dGTP diphosphatase